MEEAGDWSVYFVRTRSGALYTGVSTDVERRLEEHTAGLGAKALRGKGPLALVWSRAIGERGAALRVERMLKRLPKTEKERIVVTDVPREELLARLDADR